MTIFVTVAVDIIITPQLLPLIFLTEGILAFCENCIPYKAYGVQSKDPPLHGSLSLLKTAALSQGRVYSQGTSKSGDIVGSQNWGGRAVDTLLALGGQAPGMLPPALQCTGQPPPQRVSRPQVPTAPGSRTPAPGAAQKCICTARRRVSGPGLWYQVPWTGRGLKQ